MSNDQTISAGLAFMQAAAAAASKTKGDRERVMALRDAMQVAIRNCFEFSKQDGAVLLSLGLETRAGDFRPLDFYREGCVAGGAYPEMWETHHQLQPWVGRKAIISSHVTHGYRVLDDNRVAPGMAVLMPESFDNPDDSTLMVQGMQVWWMNAMTDDLIRVCRYRLTPEELANRTLDTAFLHHSRSPFRVRTLLREEWVELNAAPPEEKKAA
jgi:hypothetical protein